jgi:hypothetical protein
MGALFRKLNGVSNVNDKLNVELLFKKGTSTK